MAPPPVIRLHPDDSVVIARATLLPGTPVADGVGARPSAFPPATRSRCAPIAAGEPVRRYGQIIGFASRAIAPGQHVHVQNCEMGDFAKDYGYGVDARPTDYANTPATFEGIRRPDGRVATRNYIGILTSVNCSRARRGAGRRRVPPQPVHRRRPAGRVSRTSMAWWR